MSKAFTSEETPELGALVREPPRLRPGEVRYVTPEGWAELRARLERLRIELGEAIRSPESERAARVGDVERRLALLNGTLASLTVLGPDNTPEGKVGFGTWVTVDDREGRRTTWRIVGPDEADPGRGLVSVHSPVGRALLGREAGDIVEVERPDRLREYTVIEIRRVAP